MAMAMACVAKCSPSTFLFFLRFTNPSKSLSFLPTSHSKFLSFSSNSLPSKSYSSSSSSSPYPLQYDLIISRPNSPSSPHLPRSKSDPQPHPTHSSDSDSDSPEPPPPHHQLSFHDWVDNKLAQHDTMDKSKKKYYNKRRKRMYGSDSDDERRRQQKHGGFVELKPDVVDFRTLHKREEELYFYDTFAMPWEKDKHYKMVYQLEKKYFPDQCLDNAFLQPHQQPPKKPNTNNNDKHKDKGLVFFDEKDADVGGGVKDLSDKKVEEFFRCLKKVPGGPKGGEVSCDMEPFLATRTTGLPPKWDTPAGTVLLVNKPKGWTSFTVCGKLRRLTKIKKVGHAGTLDPMATGLLIVCVGKSTKLVDRYQGMIKGYSGVFRLGEATSTWDADSPVIQREPWEHIKDEDIKKAVASFTGEIWQVPPMFSAIKVGGEKMYDKARRGESIELAPRRISIFKFDIERSLEDRQNLIFRVTCSKGTYIRSLCADFGKALGSCAHLVALRRDSIGEYSADDAYEFRELEEQMTKGYF